MFVCGLVSGISVGVGVGVSVGVGFGVGMCCGVWGHLDMSWPVTLQSSSSTILRGAGVADTV